MVFFGDFPPEYARYETARVAILPIPFDKTCSWVKGAAGGPGAILQASKQLENYDLHTGLEVYRQGIYTDTPIEANDSGAMIDQTYARVKTLRAEGKLVVSLGGEHSVALGAVRALSEEIPDLTVLQLDAHADSREEYEGSRFSHACVMSRIKEWVSQTVAVGIRSLDVAELERLDQARTFYAHEMRRSAHWMEEAVKKLSGSVYVTIDLDVFDPSLVPATGTPEPGGLQWYEVLNFLEKVAQAGKVVGFDVVELCPMGHHASEFLAAKLVYVFLSILCKYQAW